MSELYKAPCKPAKSKFYGVGSKLNVDGTIADPGRVNGTLVVELKGWVSYVLTAMVFSIIAQEVFGYEVSYYYTSESGSMAQRMSSVGAGVCTPVHANIETWATAAVTESYSTYSNESYSSGSIGYSGRSGAFTTKDFVKKGLDETVFTPTYSADFWRDYAKSENLIKSIPVDNVLKNPTYYPPQETACANNTQGCWNSCSKTAACTAREAQTKTCMVVVLMYDYYDPGYMQAVFENLDIPSYFCFLGYDGMQNYAIESLAKGKPVVFYHYEPDPLHFQYEGKFERIALPRTTPEESIVDTGTFGENGDGKKTNNPVKVDFPFTSLEKYSASLLQDQPLLASLISRMTISEFQVNKLMRKYVQLTSTTPQPEDAVFSTACSWIKENYRVWNLWLDRLPMCSLITHVTHEIIGCEDLTAAAVFPRRIEFSWRSPHPDSHSLPYNCDGGLTQLPDPLITSRSCEWLKANVLIWIFWVSTTNMKPDCDATFYSYNISRCDHPGSKREVQYYWMIPDATNASLSAECIHGVALPTPVLLDCEFVPYDAGGFVVVAVLASLLAALLLIAMGFVYHYRALPIIKRSQYQFLLVLLAGGIMICGAVWLYAGEPTAILCKFRPAGIAIGFTLIFGALVVKSLRVYRVFMSGAMKRVVLSTRTMFKILGIFLFIDIVILVAWAIVDPSLATTTTEATAELGGEDVERLQCTSTSFIFTALLIFWKAVLLFAGLYLSFLIRKVSSDFQESVWIFASAIVVLFTSLILLPMAYLVDLPAETFYLFFAFLLLVSTATVMALMIVPKILRLHALASDSASSGGSTGAGDTNSGENSTRPDNGNSNSNGGGGDKKEMKSVVPSAPRLPGAAFKKKVAAAATVKVTPVKQFTDK
uniref:G-protein coupled receptors family 3 profile domain-containing protein n=1 Tax=Globisporangium ultimum (strain ATCC 200006 / CBS 805.95 / DAOM BR144) TaxID=431595 RepID=K3WZR0_GLOUD